MMKSLQPPIDWWTSILGSAERFAAMHGATYDLSKKQLFGLFEVGCFLAIVRFYERRCTITVENLKKGEFRYLTSPSGDPDNFSFITGDAKQETFTIRQQIRIRSHLHKDICFTPDIVVLRDGAKLRKEWDPSYAGGSRRFFVVDSDEVIAVHECKSTNPFPELFVGFVGMLYIGHKWMPLPSIVKLTQRGLHLAPTLFVGGATKAKHVEMIEGLQSAFPINIVAGMHEGNMDLRSVSPMLKKISMMKAPSRRPNVSRGSTASSS